MQIADVKEIMKVFLADPGREIKDKLFFTEQEVRIISPLFMYSFS